MWKCPVCGQKNRIDTCTKCGTERVLGSKASISSFSFVVMTIISLAIIIGIFFAVDAAIDYKRRQQSHESQLSEESFEPYVAPVIEQTEK